MDYDDEDYYSHGEDVEGEFNEDSLPNDEYDKLYELLPKLKAKLKDYNDEIPQQDLKEALYYNYYELGPSIEELKSKFKKKKIEKIKQSFDQPSPDDKILQAQSSAFNDNFGNLKLGSKPKSPSPAPAAAKTKKKLDIESKLASNKTYSKPHKSFVVIGHVDAGKSTLMGRILLDYGIVDAKTVDKLVKESTRAGKGSFALAWILDQTEEERSHGVTVDICATDFETSTTRFTAIDAPGHRDFVPQMIGGVSQADFALLVVDAIEGEFESGFAMDGQTKEHTILAKNLGIEKLCIAINKLDKEDWSQDRFNQIKLQLTEYLTSDEVEFTEDQLDFIPISGLSGNNVVNRDESIESFNWYKGPTLGKYLETVKLSSNIDSKKVQDEEFYLTVSDSFKDKGEIKVTGKIISGVIESGDTIVSLPSDITLSVQSLLVANNKFDFAINGEVVQLTFKANQVTNDTIDPFRIGDLIAHVGSPIHTVKKFTISLHLFNLDKPLLVGTPFVLFRNNCQVPARIIKLIEVTSSQKKKKKKNLLHLVSKQTAIVEIEIEGNPLPLTIFKDNKTLGRIVIRREGSTVGAGTVIGF
ncbi:putative elongation factor 1 alpha-like protein [Scheffersomyces amazonensis]|uniref:putative elongation factor 1 alpha-like protein n=1 Tax=Scheffersomyces amazonensis TaxID=1078765 RepID=UPI00315C9CB6